MQAAAYPGFCSMKRLGVFLHPAEWESGYPGLFHHVPSYYHNTAITTKLLEVLERSGYAKGPPPPPPAINASQSIKES